jgi:hypothetical protein
VTEEVERTARATIEEQMTRKGYTKVEGDADCYIAIHAKVDEWFDGGLFKIEVLDGTTGNAVWRGKAEGALNVKSTPKRQKAAQRVIKKMFKSLPSKRTE